MLDGNVLLRQKRDEVPEGTLSCPDRNLAVFHHCRRYEGLRLLPSVCEQIIIQQTLIGKCQKARCQTAEWLFSYRRKTIVKLPKDSCRKVEGLWLQVRNDMAL